jgi:hypothetical protein
MNYDAYGNPIKPKSSGVLLPVVLALLASAGGNYWLWKERTRLSAEAFTATAKLTASEAIQKETIEKVATLQAERDELVVAKEQAVKDAQAKATELAKLKDDVAGVEVAKEPEAEGDEKSKTDAKPAKNTTEKADKKADSKSKSHGKKKKEKAESSHKKDHAGSSAPAGEREL